MKKAGVFILLTTLLCSQAVFSSEESRIEAERLLDTMGMQESFEHSIEQMLDLQMQQSPELVPYKHVMLKFFAKHMSYEGLKPQLVDLYATAFTESELKDINAFYATPTGKKTLEKIPELVAQGAQIGSMRVQENIQELQDMIRAEAERIQKNQSK